jgi:Zn-dependent M28 family amino/carboxypeptidase
MLKIILAAALAFQTAAGAPKFDSNRAWEHLRQLVAIGPRPSGSVAVQQAQKYIATQLAAAGLTTVEQRWTDDTPAGKVAMVNLIATIPGAARNRIIIAGHYDTKRFTQFRFLGANDGASSAAFVLEMARVLKARKNPLTIELVFFDGEEAVNTEWRGLDNTYGSRHYVEVAKRENSLGSLKAMILVDMIGGRNLRIKRDSASTPWLNDVIWSAAKRLKLDDHFVPQDTTIGGDDHFPFLQAAIPSVDIIDLEYEHWHTAGDTLDAVSARSLQVVGDVLLAALPQIEARLNRPAR